MSRAAEHEIIRILNAFGDENPVAKRTIARGIFGVKTNLDARIVVQELRALLGREPSAIEYTLKWVPVDLWVGSDIESMREAVAQLRDRIKHGECWRMTVEKRRYTLCHTIDIIDDLAQLVDKRVDLENPDKILRIDIIGKYAGVSVLSPQDIFSKTK